jgi:hypothetical protein
MTRACSGARLDISHNGSACLAPDADHVDENLILVAQVAIGDFFA